MSFSNFVVPSSAEAIIYGISHIELTARRVKVFRSWCDKRPVYNVSRKGLQGDESVYALLEHAKSKTVNSVT